MLNAVLIGAAVHLVTIPIWGALSDRFGRKPVYLLGAVGVGVWAFAFIYLIDTESFALTVLAVVGGLVFHGAMYGPQAAFLSELFGTKVRYSGVSDRLPAGLDRGRRARPDHRRLALHRSTAATRSRSTWRCPRVITVLAVATYGETRKRDLAADHAVAIPAASRPLTSTTAAVLTVPTAGGGRIAPVSETALELLRLLAQDAPAERIEEQAAALAAADPRAGPLARELALRVRAGIDAHQRREAELAALVETARDLASRSDPGGVLDAIVRRARTLLGTDVAYLTLADPERGDTFMRATAGSVSARFQTLRLPTGAGLGGLVAQTRRPYWTADYPADEPLPAHQRDRRRGRRGGPGRHLRHPAAGRRPVRRGAVRLQPQPPPVPPRRGGAARLAGHAGRGVAGADPAGHRDRRRAGRAVARRTPRSSRRPRRTTGSPASCSAAAAWTTSRPRSASCWAAGWPCSTPTGSGWPRTARRPGRASRTRWPAARRCAARRRPAGSPRPTGSGRWR